MVPFFSPFLFFVLRRRGISLCCVFTKFLQVKRVVLSVECFVSAVPHGVLSPHHPSVGWFSGCLCLSRNLSAAHNKNVSCDIYTAQCSLENHIVSRLMFIRGGRSFRANGSCCCFFFAYCRLVTVTMVTGASPGRTRIGYSLSKPSDFVYNLSTWLPLNPPYSRSSIESLCLLIGLCPLTISPLPFQAKTSFSFSFQ